jgi:hypothetical protein
MSLGSFAFYAQELQQPNLKFDYSLASATSGNSRLGIRIHGPYDKNLFPNPKVKVAFLSDNRSGSIVSSFNDWLADGLEGYPGFNDLMRVGLDSQLAIQAKDDNSDFERKLRQVVQSDPHMAFVIVDRYSRQSLYSKIKSVLLGSGIPCQVINRQTLEKPPDQLQWVLPNIALSVYANREAA